VRVGVIVIVLVTLEYAVINQSGVEVLEVVGVSVWVDDAVLVRDCVGVTVRLRVIDDDCVLDGEPLAEPLAEGDIPTLVEVDGVGDTELKLINILNEYLHTGLSDINVIVVVCPY
jgi:hypothetical protein